MERRASVAAWRPQRVELASGEQVLLKQEGALVTVEWTPSNQENVEWQILF